MDYMVQWCLVCERRLEHQGLYCSPKCLKADFVLTPLASELGGEALGANRRSAKKPNRKSAGHSHVLLSMNLSGDDHQQSPVPTPASSAASFSTDRFLSAPHSFHGHSSSLMVKHHQQYASLHSNPHHQDNGNSVVFVDLHEFQQSILAPEFSLGFQSRPRMQPAASMLTANSVKVTAGTSRSIGHEEDGLRAALRNHNNQYTADK
ncbi:hypothetical protein BDR26DRAFT_858603 [Obelidium mucronatum]|nr:hypothetical protein BDR26DRAFT_858603 [Obelidium mucronatum]